MSQTADHDAELLGKLGYAQELLRAMGGFSSFALSFSIISVITGIFSTYKTALEAGGPFGLTVGWPLVSVGALVVGLAMAELASAFPTAGALYHWASVLGGPSWGWLTAMINLVGQIAIVGAIDLICAQKMSSVTGINSYVLFALVLAVHALLNAASVRWVAFLNDASVVVHIAGVVLLIGALRWFGESQSAEFLVAKTTASDGPYAWGFLTSLLLGMWTFTGFDASAHVSEETHNPARRAPWGIVNAVLVSAVIGYALLLTLTLAIKDTKLALADGDTVLFVLHQSLGSIAGTSGILVVIVAMWFCGLSSLTSASRMLFAFSRDGGLPRSADLRRVGPRKTPYVATFACAIASGALVGITAPLSEAVFTAVSALATTALYVSYALPVALGLRARIQKRWHHRGPWHLGRFGSVIAVLAIAWTAFVLFVCTLADQLSGKMLGATVAVLATVAFGVLRGRFTGPKVDLKTFEQRARGGS